MTKTPNSTRFCPNATRKSKAYPIKLFVAVLTMSFLIASPASSWTITPTCHDSIAQSQKDNVLISLLDVEPKQFSALGNNFSIREAWLEKYSAKYKPSFYWLCFSLNENGEPHVDKAPHTPDVSFDDVSRKRSVLGHLGSPRSANLKRHILKRNRKYPIIYSMQCRLDETEATIIVLTTKPVSMTSDDVIETPSAHHCISKSHPITQTTDACCSTRSTPCSWP